MICFRQMLRSLAVDSPTFVQSDRPPASTGFDAAEESAVVKPNRGSERDGAVPAHAPLSVGSFWRVAKPGLLGSMAAMAILTGASINSARGEVIIAYDATNSADGAAASEILSSVVPLDLSRGEGLGAAGGGTYNSSGWTADSTDYLEWGWSSSIPLDLTDLDLRYDRSSSGPAGIEIQLSVNGGDFDPIYTDADVLVDGEDAFDINLTGFTGVTSAAFRLLGSGASSASGTFDIEPLTGVVPDRGIVVNGVASVPEPSGLLLLGMAGLPAVYVLRRRRQKSST